MFTYVLSEFFFIVKRFPKSLLLPIAKISMMSPIDINVPTRALSDTETKGSFVPWLENLNIKRNLTSMFVNRYLRYMKSRTNLTITKTSHLDSL